jgi:hypothetical protein
VATVGLAVVFGEAVPAPASVPVVGAVVAPSALPGTGAARIDAPTGEGGVIVMIEWVPAELPEGATPAAAMVANVSAPAGVAVSTATRVPGGAVAAPGSGAGVAGGIWERAGSLAGSSTGSDWRADTTFPWRVGPVVGMVG